MKKLITIILIFALCLSVCACGKSDAVKNVESLISSIGTVTVTSSDSIKAAEVAYNALSSEDKDKVDNYAALEKAKSDFAALGIHLSIDNYTKYLDVLVDAQLVDGIDFAEVMGFEGITSGNTVFRGIETSVVVNGKSSNYDYNDVIVTVKFTGKYVPFSIEIMDRLNKNLSLEEYYAENTNGVDLTLIAETDIVGNGADKNVISIPSDYWVMNDSVFWTMKLLKCPAL